MAKPRTPAKTTKARDGWPRYYKFRWLDLFVVRLDSKERGMFFDANSEEQASPETIKRCLYMSNPYKRITKAQAVALFPRAATADMNKSVEERLLAIEQKVFPPHHIGDNDSWTGPEEPKPTEYPPDVVKVWRDKEQHDRKWFKHADGRMTMKRIHSQNSESPMSSEGQLDAGVSYGGSPVELIYTRPEPVKPSAPDLEAMANDRERVREEMNALAIFLANNSTGPGRIHHELMACYDRGVAFSRHAESERVRQLEARVLELTARCNRFEDRAKRCAELESKLGLIKHHLTQWNLAKTNVAANQAVSNAFNEVTS